MRASIISDIPPFKMFGELYFVGSSKVSVHIINTDDGIVMIDTGYPDMYEQIIHSIKALGFSPENICAIFHSHGHIDHFGCTDKFKALSGAATYISRIDNDIVNGTYDLSWATELGEKKLPPFNCDVLVEDGDIFQFGNTRIRCVLTPGHTDGVLSFFIDLSDDEHSIIAAMHGGVGLNSMAKEFLNKYGLSLECRDTFRQGLRKLANERVDLVLGNHPYQNDTAEKQKIVASGNGSILDHTEWKRFLLATENKLDMMLEKENL